MIFTHLKQAWQLLRQNKLFSTIYIVGTALAIASTTIFAIAYYIRIAPVYPEYQRGRMGFIERINHEGSKSSGLSIYALDNLIYSLKSVDKVSGVFVNDNIMIDLGIENLPIKSRVRYTDPTFFEIFSFDFIEGRPFSKDEFQNSSQVITISDLLAESIFGTSKGIVGKHITLSGNDYTICGVFKEPSTINVNSHAQIIAPYTIAPAYPKYHSSEFVGQFSAVILSDNFDAVKNELDEISRRYNTGKAYTDENDKLTFPNSPVSNLQRVLGAYHGNDVAEMIRKNILMLLVLLIVPALNLSGMIAGRMDNRQSELGIRKSFGANRYQLLSQVLWENLFLTILGGILGLIIAWLIIYKSYDWLIASISGSIPRLIPGGHRLTPDMLFAPAVFLSALIFCLILNVVSAILPAWHAINKTITNTLK